MRQLHAFFASAHADDRPDASSEPAVPEGQGAAPDLPVPPVGTARPASLVADAADGKRGAAWRLFHWVEQDHPEAVEAVRSFPDGRLLYLLLEWLALGTWAGKHFQVPPAMRQPHFRAQIRALFLFEEHAQAGLAGQVLFAGLHDVRPQVRENAAHLLGMLGDPAAIPDLIEALRDPTPGVRVQAAKALGQMRATQAAPALAAALSYHDEALASQIRQALLRCGAPATLPLVNATRSPDAWVRWHALRVLAELHDMQAVPGLIERLADTNHAVAWMAARGLASMGAPPVEEVLRLLLRAPDTLWLMETAAYVLRARRDEPLRPILEPVIRSMHSVDYRVEVPLAVERALAQLAQVGWRGA